MTVKYEINYDIPPEKVWADPDLSEDEKMVYFAMRSFKDLDPDKDPTDEEIMNAVNNVREHLSIKENFDNFQKLREECQKNPLKGQWLQAKAKRMYREQKKSIIER